MPGKFELKKTSNGQYRFNLKAGNGEIIATSESYKSKSSAMNGIESVKKNAADAKVDDQTGEYSPVVESREPTGEFSTFSSGRPLLAIDGGAPSVPNRNLKPDELAAANALLDEIRSRLDSLAGGDAELRFAYNRKLFKELSYDERSRPMVRRKLKIDKRAEQGGNGAICHRPLPEKYAVLDRLSAPAG